MGIENRDIEIKITHKLYGNQRIKGRLRLIDDADRLGFYINDQEIYIEKKEICDFGFDNGICFWADKIMRIEIKTT